MLRALVDVVVPRGAVELLLDDELGAAGDAAETAFAHAVERAGPGGAVAVAVRGAVHAALTGAPRGVDGRRRFSAAELRHLAEHFGCRVELLCAPGAAAAVADRAWAGVDDLDADRTPGLLDAGPVLLLVATAPPDPATRSARFFAAIPRKVVATAVLCRDADGRVLCVHDSFRGAWTVPGGIVDADEDPRAAAAREAWEEAGVRIAVGDLVGVAAASWPDRLLLYFAATPAGAGAGDGDGDGDGGTVPVEPRPVHPHEVDEVAWLDVDEALNRVAADVAGDLRRCLDAPGTVWRR